MKNIKLILFVTLIACIALFNDVNAQVSTEFSNIIIVQSDYQEIDNITGVRVLNEEVDFVDMPKTSGSINLDDGYAEVPLNFDYDFNGETYSKIFININGFVTFGEWKDGRVNEPPLMSDRLREPAHAFFEDDNSYPVNVIAPFWGDHFLRNDAASFNQFLHTEIAYVTFTEGVDPVTGKDIEVFVVEWKNLNINYKDELGAPVKSSVANFQLRIYKSLDAFSLQGDIEFCYGYVGGNDAPGIGTDVITYGAVVGIKGYKQANGDDADFLNALAFDQPMNVIDSARVSKERTVNWTPSGYNNYRIRFISAGKTKEADWWGDGDVDFSKVLGGKHHNLNDGTPATQCFWVTANDARVIMNAIATEIPLEPTIERSAYHGDVDHDGRYFYNISNEKVKIPWKSEKYNEDLDNEETKDITNPKQHIFYEVTSYDAALIFSYLSVNVPQLPWLLDFDARGKVTNEAIANDIVIGEYTKVANNVYQLPVYLNGTSNGPLAIELKVDGTIESVIENDDINMLSTFTPNKVVVVTDNNIDNETPVFYVNVRTNNETINVSDVVFNKVSKEDYTVALANTNIDNDNELPFMLVNPNPVKENGVISMNIVTDGNYKVSLYDMTGRVISELHSGRLNAGNNKINFNVSNLNHGVYFIKAEGNNNIETCKVVVE